MIVKMAKIGVLFDQKAAESKWKYGLNTFNGYSGEVLSHAGIPFEWLHETNHILENGFDIVIVAEMQEQEDTYDKLRSYVAKGGIAVSYGGLNGMAKSLGCMYEKAAHEGYATFRSEWAEERPLRFLRAVPWRTKPGEATSCETVGEATETAANREPFPIIQRFPIGNGWLERWSVDLMVTIVGLQQGTRPITVDGPPAPDGTAWLDDDRLKAEDGHEMDWQRDRLVTETGAPYFAHPYADLWREAAIGHLLQRIRERGKTVPFIGYWPEGIRSVAMLSHDSDRNHDEDAVTTMQVLQECGIHSTWCMMKSGYSYSIHEQIREAGHELALHFNSNVNEGGNWSEEDFRRQSDWLESIIGGSATSNKNHFTRFEGWGELFAWCESCGIESDQTRGPSKKGTVGFLFGTCHTYFPIAWANDRNRLYNVLEIGFLTQDLTSMTDYSVVAPFLEQVKRVEGIAHLLFHQGRIHSAESVRLALGRFVEEAKQQGFVFWTGKQINDWERARRGMKIQGIRHDGKVIGQFDCSAGKPAIWRPLLLGETVSDGEIVEHKFGIWCKRG